MAASIKPSPGRKSDKVMRDALVLALHREADGLDGRPTKRLYIIADQLVRKACEGDVPAIKEVMDRVDGKAHQSVDLDLNGTLNLHQALTEAK